MMQRPPENKAIRMSNGALDAMERGDPRFITPGPLTGSSVRQAPAGAKCESVEVTVQDEALVKAMQRDADDDKESGK